MHDLSRIDPEGFLRVSVRLLPFGHNGLGHDEMPVGRRQRDMNQGISDITERELGNAQDRAGEFIPDRGNFCVL